MVLGIKTQGLNHSRQAFYHRASPQIHFPPLLVVELSELFLMKKNVAKMMMFVDKRHAASSLLPLGSLSLEKVPKLAFNL